MAKLSSGMFHQIFGKIVLIFAPNRRNFTETTHFCQNFAHSDHSAKPVCLLKTLESISQKQKLGSAHAWSYLTGLPSDLVQHGERLRAEVLEVGRAQFAGGQRQGDVQISGRVADPKKRVAGIAESKTNQVRIPLISAYRPELFPSCEKL